MTKTRAAHFVAFVLLSMSVIESPAHADEAVSPPTLFPVHIHVALPADVSVDRAWLDAQLASANQLFADSGIEFREASLRDIDRRHATLVTREDRHALGRWMSAGVINVFVVASLGDVDEPGRLRQGVHWRPRGAERGAHFVIISVVAGRSTLAHELGHFFDNPHSPTPNNVMSYTRDGITPPFFDAAQRTRIARARDRFLRTREVVPVSAPP